MKEKKMNQESLFGEPTIAEKTDAMLDRFAASADPDKVDEMKRVESAIERLARTGREFTADDVRKEVGWLKTPNVVGVAFHVAAKRRLIRRTGYVLSSVPSRHGAIIRSWQGIARVR